MILPVSRAETLISVEQTTKSERHLASSGIACYAISAALDLTLGKKEKSLTPPAGKTKHRTLTFTLQDRTRSRA
jgi:hypothetical protein